MKPSVARARTERLRARLANDAPLHYPELKDDLNATFAMLRHYRDDAETIRKEKELIWAKAVGNNREQRERDALEWSVVAITWITAAGVWIHIFFPHLIPTVRFP